MNNNLEQAIKLLRQDNLTCAIIGQDINYTSTQRGITPLLICYRNSLVHSHCSAADKVVGRAAAFLYVLLEIDSLYAEVISRPALTVLEDAGINVAYSTLVDAIINRAGTGFCPMESAVLSVNDPHEALEAVENALERLRG